MEFVKEVQGKVIGKIVAADQEDALRLVEHFEMQPGEMIYCKLESLSRVKLLSCCPNCGAKSFSGNHKITIEAGDIITAQPSLIFQCCGWHGWLKKNKFTT